MLFALAIRSVRVVGPAPEPQAADVQLIRLQPPPPRRPPQRTAPTTPSTAPASAAPARAQAPAVAAPAAPSAVAAHPSASDDAAGRVRAMLRGSTGCGSAALLRLDEAERRKCARWRMAGTDPNLQIPAPIDPVKKTWFDADLHDRDIGRRMPMGPPGSLSEEGKKLTYGLPPGHPLFHLGPFGVGLPAGAFNDDDAPPP